jgi:peptide chain release factor 1
MLAEETLDRLLDRHRMLAAQLSSQGAVKPEAIGRLSKEYSELTPVADAVSGLKKLRHEIAELAVMATGEDAEMRNLAADELMQAKARLPGLERQVQLMLLPKDEADEKNAILELRAGTGGLEAALFASDLWGMYRRYAEGRGWKFETLSISENDLGGFKDASATITGRGVFARLKFESGVHRVQRVPVTEAQGRIHTSTATVAVLPEAEDVDIEIEDKDLRVDVFRAQGAGGQHVNTTDSAVRITHLPTGLVVNQQDEKSQHKNRAKAMKVLRARLYDLERQKRDSERAATRRAQVGTGDRSERIRTYNFPQGRVTDHRINVTLYEIDAVIAGTALDKLIDALVSEDEAQRLAELDGNG